MDTPLQPDHLARLLRDLVTVSDKVLVCAVPADAKRLAWLLQRLPETDLRTDADLQQRLARYLAIRGKLRAAREPLYRLIESLKADSPPTLAVLLARLYDLTGQVEKAAASHLLALFDPTQPVIDRALCALLPRYGFATLGEAASVEASLAYHQCLRVLYSQVLSATGWFMLESRMNAALGGASHVLSQEAKLGLLLCHARRPIVLSALAPLEPARVTRAGRQSAKLRQMVVR